MMKFIKEYESTLSFFHKSRIKKKKKKEKVIQSIRQSHWVTVVIVVHEDIDTYI